MATFTDAQAIFGLSASSEATGTRTTGSVLVGLPQTAIRFSNSRIKAWSFRALFSGYVPGQGLDFKPDGLNTDPDAAFVAGAAQAEYIDGTGTIGTGGNATVTVTADGLSGSPKAVSVPVLSGDTAAVWIAKAKAALEADASIAAMFTFSISGASSNRLTIKRRPIYTNPNVSPAINYYVANDSTLNMAVANGTCSGITAVTTSTTETAGVKTTGIKVIDADGKDWEGNGFSIDTYVYGILIENISGDTHFTNDSGASIKLTTGNKMLISGNEGTAISTIMFPIDGVCRIEQFDSDFSDTIITILAE